MATDIGGAVGIHAAIAAAEDALADARAEMAAEASNPANHGLERLIKALAQAQINIAQALRVAAENVNK